MIEHRIDKHTDEKIELEKLAINEKNTSDDLHDGEVSRSDYTTASYDKLRPVTVCKIVWKMKLQR